jgi:hypothetical protein
MNYIVLVIAAVILIGIGIFAMSLLQDGSRTTSTNIESLTADFLQKESGLQINYQKKVNGEKEELEFVVQWPDSNTDVEVKEFSHGWFVLRPMIVNARLLDDVEQRWVPDQRQAVYIKLPSRDWYASGFIISNGDAIDSEQKARALLKEAFDGLPINGG